MFLEPIHIPRALNTGTCLRQGDLFYSAGLHKNHMLATANTEKNREKFRYYRQLNAEEEKEEEGGGGEEERKKKKKERKKKNEKKLQKQSNAKAKTVSTRRKREKRGKRKNSSLAILAEKAPILLFDVVAVVFSSCTVWPSPSSAVR